MSEQVTTSPSLPKEEKRKGGLRGLPWGLPLLYALPFLVLGAAAALKWGREIRNLIQVLVKLVVRA